MESPPTPNNGAAGKALPPISMDAARTLQQVMVELEHVRKQLRQPFAAKATIEASLARLEGGLKVQSEELFRASVAEAQRQQAAQRESVVMLGAAFKTKPRPLPPIVPSAAERVAMFKADPINRPQTDAARTYLQDRYGVPTPTKRVLSADKPGGSGYGAGTLSKGITSSSAPGVILPRHLREDPYCITPPEVTDLELDKGLLHLVNRRMLPGKADLTPALIGGDMGAVKMGSAPVYPHSARFVRPPPTTALEDSLLANTHFKLDLLTPVVKPPEEARTATMRFVEMHPDGSARPVHEEVAEGHQAPTAPAESEDARTFDVLMDTFSLHEFMIRKGEAITNTPEFVSYQRTYEPLWDIIKALIQQLEVLCKQYAVPLVIVDGKSLADLAHGVMDSGFQPQMQDLLVCIQNIQEVAALLRQPGRRFLGDGGSNDAATTIQAAFRGHMARRKYSKHGRAAGTIQAAWRMHRLRHQLIDRLRQARKDRDAHFQALQQQLYQQWPLMQRAAHVVVHVPSCHRLQSMTLPQKDALLVAEAAQLVRLCDLAEPLVEVLLVLPYPPDDDVVAYWNKILEVGGVQDPASRYRIIFPENHQRLPAHMSVTAKLLASPRALKRVRAAVHGRLAYMVPGIVNDEDVDLAVQLGIPMLGPVPYTARALARKSSARTLFQSAGVNLPPGLMVLPRAQLPPPPKRVGPNGVEPLKPNTDFQITEEGEVVILENAPPPPPPSRTQYEEDEARVIMLLAEAMVRSPTVNKWLIKVDDEVQGCGHAYFETLSIKGALDVLERTIMEEGEEAASADPAVQLTEAQQVAVYRLNELLYRHLPKKLHLAAREVYPTYRDFISGVAVRGGVIEACPHAVVGSPCANILVDPQGNVLLLSTHERVFVYPYRAMGTTFPQSSVPHRALADACQAVGAAAFQAGVLGHVCVDFITMQEEDGALRLWAVDMVPYPTTSLMAYQLFDFLTVGSFDPATGTYTVELEPFDDVSQSQAMSAAPPLPPAPPAAEGSSSTVASVTQNWLAPALPPAGPDGAPLSLEAAAAAAAVTGAGPAATALQQAAAAAAAAAGFERGSAGSFLPWPGAGDLPSQLPSPASSASPSFGGAAPEDPFARISSQPGSAPAALAAASAPARPGSGASGASFAQPPGSAGAGAGAAAGGGGSGAASRPASALAPVTPLPTQSQRFFFALDAVTHPSIAATSCSKLFHACWQEGMHFDVDNRVGIIFNLSDKYLLGTLGVMAVGMAPHEIYGTMQEVLTFIAGREAEVAAAGGTGRAAGGGGGASGAHGGGGSAAGEGLATFRDLQALVKYMVEKSAAVIAAATSSLPTLTGLGAHGARHSGAGGSALPSARSAFSGSSMGGF